MHCHLRLPVTPVILQLIHETNNVPHQSSAKSSNAAGLIHQSSQYEHVTPVLRDLHWLRSPERIDFKLAVLTYRCLHGLVPQYLSDYIQRVADSNRCRLRPPSPIVVILVLLIRRTQLSTVGDRAFPVSERHLWNSLPPNVTSAQTPTVFRNRLKTYLFSRSFPS